MPDQSRVSKRGAKRSPLGDWVVKRCELSDETDTAPFSDVAALKNFLTPLVPALGTFAPDDAPHDESLDRAPATNGSSGGTNGSKPMDESLANREGWPFGRDLYVSEIYSLVQNVQGVKHVRDVRLSKRHVVPAKEWAARQEEKLSEEMEAYRALQPVDQRRVEVPGDTLLCSLDHEVVIVDL